MQSPSFDVAPFGGDAASQLRTMPGAWTDQPRPVAFLASPPLFPQSSDHPDLSPPQKAPDVPPTTATPRLDSESFPAVPPKSLQNDTATSPFLGDREPLVSTDNWAPSVDDIHSFLSTHLAGPSTELSPAAEILAVGDDALSTYYTLLLNTPHLQAPLPSRHPVEERAEGNLREGETIGESGPIEGEPIDGESDPTGEPSGGEPVQEGEPIVESGYFDATEPILVNPLSDFSEDALASHFNTIIDIRTALSLRKSVVVVQIGYLLGQLSEKFVRYDKDNSVIEAVDREIGAVKEAVAQNGIEINLQALECFRSKYKPECGESFFEKNRFLIADVQDYLDDHEDAYAAASQFFTDPTSLRERRLAHFFPNQR